MEADEYMTDEQFLAFLYAFEFAIKKAQSTEEVLELIRNMIKMYDVQKN